MKILFLLVLVTLVSCGKKVNECDSREAKIMECKLDYLKSQGVFNAPIPGWIKDQCIKESSALKLSPDDITQHWNDFFGERFGFCPTLNFGVHQKNVFESLKILQTREDWCRIFDMILKSKFLCGQNDRGWTVTLTWLVNPDNLIRVMQNEFNEEFKAKKYLDSLFPGEEK